MNLLTYAVVGLVVTWLLYIGYVYVATRSSEGRSSAPLNAAFPRLASRPGPALVYCFSPQCRPCRPMSDDVDRLVAEGLPIYPLDIERHPALAREFGIRATPTLIVIEDRTVRRMVLGVKTARFMRGLIETRAT